MKLSLAKLGYWLRKSVPYCECPSTYISVFCSRCPTWDSIYIRSWADLRGGRGGREFRLGNAVILSRAFGVGRAAIRSYPKWGIAIQNAPIQISALSRVRIQMKTYSGWNTWWYIIGIFKDWPLAEPSLPRKFIFDQIWAERAQIGP